MNLGEYEITNMYYNHDIGERVNKNNDNSTNYKPIISEESKDSLSLGNSSNNLNKHVESSNENVLSAISQENQRKIAVEAGFGIRDLSETHIKINSPENSGSRLNISTNSIMDSTTQLMPIKRGTTLSRPERQQTTRRRNIMRSENELPPIVRTGKF